MEDSGQSAAQPGSAGHLLLFVLGWFFLPGGSSLWTVAGLLLLFLSVLVQFTFNLGRALFKLSMVGAREGLATFASSLGFAILNLTFLPHHMFLSLDAITRSLSRRFVSGKHLLEWETAAQVESGGSRTSVDVYLYLSPIVAVALALALAFTDLPSLLPASPILALWAIAPLVANWLNSPPHQEEGPLSKEDRLFLQLQAFQLWRYFQDSAAKQTIG